MSSTTFEIQTPPDLDDDILAMEEQFISEPNPLEKAIALSGSIAMTNQTAEERELQMDELSGDGKAGYYSGYN